MKRIEKYIFIFALAAIVCLSSSPALSFAAVQTASKTVSAKYAGKKTTRKSTAARRAKKKKVKIKQTMNQTNTSAVSTGAWGANGLAMTVTETGARLEYDCASGEITGKLIIDAEGNFTANGTHKRNSPGPIRIGFEPKNQSARYEGKISGETMTLKVVTTENEKVVGEHSLTKGVTPRLHKCY